ncbi:MAG: glutaredoxin [SAR202 cluster bacterium]|nr:glutaredoxin [SAR202 cluster bacterium]
MTVQESLESTIANHPIVLFTKGDKDFPRCGWSKAVIDIFSELGVAFETVDILRDPEIRSALIAISDWPTTPQIFLKGEFIGGGDLVRELHARGELKALVDAALES